MTKTSWMLPSSQSSRRTPLTNEVKSKRLPLPSAELTYAALNLALQLPILVIFHELVWHVPWSDHKQTQSIEEWNVIKTVLLDIMTCYDGFCS